MSRKGHSLELAVLGLLQESPLHGYELRKRVNLLFGRGRLLSYGSLYPALKRMMRSGWITNDDDEGSKSLGSRRQRIVYQLTAAGTDYFASEISQAGPSAWEDDNFTLRFAFFSRTDSQVRLRILEGRRSRLQERLERTQAAPASVSDRYLSELHRHSTESVERELNWISDLIAAEYGNPAKTTRPSEREDRNHHKPQDRASRPQPLATPKSATPKKFSPETSE